MCEMIQELSRDKREAGNKATVKKQESRDGGTRQTEHKGEHEHIIPIKHRDTKQQQSSEPLKLIISFPISKNHIC